MITITESKTKAMPGLTSLFISFDYNQDIVNIFKDIELKKFDKKEKLWEIPLTELSSFIDKACYIDEIELNLLNEEPKIIKEYSLKDYKISPYKHQTEGIQFGLNNNKWLLLDPPGLGKSATVIHIAEELKEKENIEHCLIICGINTLKSNWVKEIKTHSNLSSIIIGQKFKKDGTLSKTSMSIADRVKQLSNKIDEFFIIINIENLRSEDIIKVLLKGPNKYDIIAVDEIHKCVSPSAQQSLNLLSLNKSKYQIGMTGTLLLNDPLDAYIPLKWIGVEKSCLSTFKSYYYKYGGVFGNEVVGYKNIDVLKDQITKYSLRRDRSGLDMPPKNILQEYVDMEEPQISFYNNIKKGIIEQVDKVNIKKNNLLAMVTRLRQASSCPSILTTEDINSAKIDRAIDMTAQLVESGYKVVLFTIFKDVAKNLYEKLKEYGASLNTGDTEDNIVSKNVDDFQNNPESKIFIGTTKKCGTGITLNSAYYMIFIDTPWTSAEFDQCCDRIYRITNKEPVFIYELITKDTIDEKVHNILQTKKAVSDYIIDNKIENKEAYNILQQNEIANGITWEDNNIDNNLFNELENYIKNLE